MAKSVFYTYPLDKPAILKHGVMHKESLAPGNDRWLTLDRENPIRAKKGDLPMESIKDFQPRALSHSGLPWKNLTSGKK